MRCKLKGDFMTKVRVNEETFNLSHSSNLISTIGLEKSSPSLMRSIRVEGHTHSWVVESFLREKERENFWKAREQPFLRVRECFPKKNNNIEIEAKNDMIFDTLIVVINAYSSVQKLWHSFQDEEGHDFQDKYYLFIVGKRLL